MTNTKMIEPLDVVRDWLTMGGLEFQQKYDVDNEQVPAFIRGVLAIDVSDEIISIAKEIMDEL